MPPDPAALPALVRAGARPALERLLLAHSDLPGPRANLALARRFAAEAAALPPDEIVALVAPWLDLTLDEAPVGTPTEFLPACAAVALGTALPAASPGAAPHGDVGPDAPARPARPARPAPAPDGPTGSTLDHLLARAARDPRWRTREGLVVGLRVAGERDADALLSLAARWVASRDPFLMRAAIAALAHAPVLRRPGAPEAALAHARAAVDWLQAQPAARRSTEGGRVLTEALSLALGACVLAAPGPGFALLDDLLAGGDRATRRVVSAALGTPGLRAAHPTQVTRVKGWLFELDDWQRG